MSPEDQVALAKQIYVALVAQRPDFWDLTAGPVVINGTPVNRVA